VPTAEAVNSICNLRIQRSRDSFSISYFQKYLLFASSVVVVVVGGGGGSSGVVFVVFVVGDSGVGDGVVIIHGSSSL